MRTQSKLFARHNSHRRSHFTSRSTFLRGALIAATILLAFAFCAVAPLHAGDSVAFTTPVRVSQDTERFPRSVFGTARPQSEESLFDFLSSWPKAGGDSFQ
jgi:hypothetical protein